MLRLRSAWTIGRCSRARSHQFFGLFPALAFEFVTALIRTGGVAGCFLGRGFGGLEALTAACVAARGSKAVR